MAKIPESFPYGEIENITVPDLMRLIEKMYRELAMAINQKPDIVERATNGLVSDVMLTNGTININNNTNKVEILTKHTNPTTVTWTTLS